MPQSGDARATTTTTSGASRRRVSISSHREEIRRWVEEGYSDASIGQALGTTASSVQSFRSRAGILRGGGPARIAEGEPGNDRDAPVPRMTSEKDPGDPTATNVYEGVLDGGEEGYGLWLDPAVADDPLFKKGFTGVSDVQVVIQRGRIVLQPNPDSAIQPPAGSPAEGTVDDEAARQLESITDGTGGSSTEVNGDAGEVEDGRVKWFTKEKGYGFILRPDGNQLFFHVSELTDVPIQALSEGRWVSYEVRSNQRGPMAAAVKLRG